MRVSETLVEASPERATGHELAQETEPLSNSSLNAIDLGRGVRRYVLWDRKVDGGFPETKELKRRVRDLIDPSRGLGHVDAVYPRQDENKPTSNEAEMASNNR